MSPIESSARALLDDLASRRRLVTRVITDMAAFYGLDPRPWLDDAPAQSSVARAQPDASETTKGPIGAKRGKPDTRPTPAPTETQERILTALRTAGEPVSPGELAKAMKTTSKNVRRHIQALVAAGRVKAEGVTNGRRLSLVD